MIFPTLTISFISNNHFIGSVIPPTILRTLKELALKSLGKDFVLISSGELAIELNLSQQSASKHLVDLSEMDLIKRELKGRKQKITITQQGISTLREEFTSYARIFEEAGSLIIEGNLVTGVGEGGYYLSQDEYQESFKAILGWKPFAGTLNLELDKQAKEILSSNPVRGERVEGFKKEGRTFGGVTLYKGYVGSTPIALVIPDRGGYGTVAEFVSPYHLRRTLKLQDGDTVKVHLVRD